MGKFLYKNDAIVTVMVQSDEPDGIKALMDKAAHSGAEAFGVQTETLSPEFKTEKVLRGLFSYKSVPTYVTNYRYGTNAGKSDEALADELVALAEYGAELVDVPGDLYNPTKGELSADKESINLQMKLIERIHSAGAEVLISSHISKFTPAERVLEVAKAHKSRGADISKIVTGAANMAEQIENLRIVNLLKERLGLPFLFLSVGECSILRRVGGEIGCSMYLCVAEHDKFATPAQPLLSDILAVRRAMKGSDTK